MQAGWREFLRGNGKVLLGIEDHLIGSCGSGQLGLLLVGDCSKDACAECFSHLREQEADSARASMNQDLVTGADGIGGMREVVRGHPLQHRGRRLLRGDGFRNVHQKVDWGDGKLRIGSRKVCPGYAIAYLEAAGGGVVAQSDDDSGCLLPKDVGQRSGITAFAQIDVDEVDSRSLNADESLLRSG